MNAIVYSKGSGLRNRNPALYPAELRAHDFCKSLFYHKLKNHTKLIDFENHRNRVGKTFAKRDPYFVRKLIWGYALVWRVFWERAKKCGEGKYNPNRRGCQILPPEPKLSLGSNKNTRTYNLPAPTVLSEKALMLGASIQGTKSRLCVRPALDSFTRPAGRNLGGAFSWRAKQ